MIYVALSGSDTDTCGSAESPCRSIRQGINRATSGQTIAVRAGLYEESYLELKSNTTLVSADGPFKARIFSGETSAIRFEGISNATLDGFEVFASYDQGPEGDGLVRVLDAANCTIRNCLLHDAAHDSDVVKVSGNVTGLLLENLIAYNPGRRASPNPCDETKPWFQEVIDIYGSGTPGAPPPVDDVIVRGCWLFQTPERGGDYLLYSKINCQNILYENNIFGPSVGQGCGNTAVGIGTSEPGEPDPDAAVVRHAIVRNNIFVGCQGDGVFGIKNSEDVWVYNNTFFANGGPNLRSVIELRGNSHALGPVFIFNNVFQNNQPELDGALFYWVRENGQPSTFFHANNLFLNNIAVTDTPITGESGSLYTVDPLFTAPVIPSLTNLTFERLEQIRAGFALKSGSPAIDRGLNAIARTGHPNWKPGVTDRRWDFQQQPRPETNTWDLGTDEVMAADTTPPAVRVISPNGGETISSGSQLTISWASSDAVGVVSQAISLSTNGGTSFPTSVTTGLAGNVTEFQFAVPVSMTTTAGRIQVIARDAAGNAGLDASDANFTIGPASDSLAPTVKVLAPNGGEIVESGSPLMISWSSTDNVGVVSQGINLSTDGGNTFPTSVATGLSGMTSEFQFLIPTSLTTDSARIQVTARDLAGNAGTDTSDASFTIRSAMDTTPPVVRVIAPNGGEKLKGRASATISWESSDDTALARHDVLLSTNGGASFTTELATGLAGNLQSFTVTVPATKTKTGRIRVVAVDTSGNQSQDESDGNFKIKVK